ncbi:hypothetical protein [Bradyrhizobium sp. USDA 4502]
MSILRSMTTPTAAELKSIFDAACDAELERLRAEGLTEGDVELEMTAEMASLFEQYQAALTAEEKGKTLIEIIEGVE